MSIETVTETVNVQMHVNKGTIEYPCCGAAEAYHCPQRSPTFAQFLRVAEESLLGENNRVLAAGHQTTSPQLVLVRNLIVKLEQGVVPEPRCRSRFLDLLSNEDCSSVIAAGLDLWDVYELVCTRFPMVGSDDACCAAVKGDHCPKKPLGFIEFLSGVLESFQEMKRRGLPINQVNSILLQLVEMLITNLKQSEATEPRSQKQFVDLLPQNLTNPTKLAARDLWALYERVRFFDHGGS